MFIDILKELQTPPVNNYTSETLKNDLAFSKDK